jgi:dipeptidyl aminopeptidase/acylaminoacyl peptidase
MRSAFYRLPALGFLLLSTPARAQPVALTDGTIVEQASCAPYSPQTYAEYVASRKEGHASEQAAAKREGLVMPTTLAYASPDEFAQRNVVSGRVSCTRVVYASDGLKVIAWLWRPKDQGSKKLPLIIFNRGGNREFGKVPPWHGVHRYAAEGFVVLAPQYRGNDGGEGQEEFGGADVHDVENLIPLAQALGYVDTDNTFILGWSRGAMQTLLAVKHAMKVNAIAIGGGLLDLVAESERRPALATNVYSQLMPQFASRRDDVLRERSALYWPELITVPTLILQGTSDWRSSPTDTLTFAQKLQAAGNTYELVMYAGDDHSLSVNGDDGDRRILAWFRKHLK